MTISMYFTIVNMLTNIKNKIFSFTKDESGMGTIEVIIIIAVLVALALIFRTFIMDLADTIFDKIKSKTDAAISTL